MRISNETIIIKDVLEKVKKVQKAYGLTENDDLNKAIAVLAGAKDIGIEKSIKTISNVIANELQRDAYNKVFVSDEQKKLLQEINDLVLLSNETKRLKGAYSVADRTLLFDCLNNILSNSEKLYESVIKKSVSRIATGIKSNEGIQEFANKLLNKAYDLECDKTFDMVDYILNSKKIIGFNNTIDSLTDSLEMFISELSEKSKKNKDINYQLLMSKYKDDIRQLQNKIKNQGNITNDDILEYERIIKNIEQVSINSKINLGFKNLNFDRFKSPEFKKGAAIVGSIIILGSVLHFALKRNNHNDIYIQETTSTTQTVPEPSIETTVATIPTETTDTTETTVPVQTEPQKEETHEPQISISEVEQRANNIYSNWKELDNLNYSVKDIQELVKYMSGLESSINADIADEMLVSVINAAMVNPINNLITGGNAKICPINLVDLMIPNYKGKDELYRYQTEINEVIAGNLSNVNDAFVHEHVLMYLGDEINGLKVNNENANNPYMKLVFARLSIAFNGIIGVLDDGTHTYSYNNENFYIYSITDCTPYENLAQVAKKDLGLNAKSYTLN